MQPTPPFAGIFCAQFQSTLDHNVRSDTMPRLDQPPAIVLGPSLEADQFRSRGTKPDNVVDQTLQMLPLYEIRS